MTDDCAPALIPSSDHIVVSYLALARTHVSWSCHFFFFFFLRRSFLSRHKQMQAAEKPGWDEFTAKVAVA